MSLTRKEVIESLGIDFVKQVENAPEVKEEDLPFLLRCNPDNPSAVKEIKDFIRSNPNVYFSLMNRHNFSEKLATPEYFECLSFHNMSVGLAEYSQNFSNLAHWIIENYSKLKHRKGMQYISYPIRKAIAKYVSETYDVADEKLIGFTGEADYKYVITHKAVHEDSDLSNIPNSALEDDEFIKIIIKHFNDLKTSEFSDVEFVEYSVVSKFINNAHLVKDVNLGLQLIQCLYKFAEVHYFNFHNAYMLKVDDSHIELLQEMPDVVSAYITGLLVNSDFSVIPNSILYYAVVNLDDDFVNSVWLQANTSKDIYLREQYACNPEFNMPPVNFRISDLQNRFNNTGKVDFNHLKYASCTAAELTDFIINHVEESTIKDKLKDNDTWDQSCLSYINDNSLKIKLIKKFPSLYTYFVKDHSDYDYIKM